MHINRVKHNIYRSGIRNRTVDKTDLKAENTTIGRLAKKLNTEQNTRKYKSRKYKIMYKSNAQANSRKQIQNIVRAV